MFSLDRYVSSLVLATALDVPAAALAGAAPQEAALKSACTIEIIMTVTTGMLAKTTPTGATCRSSTENIARTAS
jgi:hypothetical protein